GEQADRTIQAPRGATYVDSERTERLRDMAMQAVPEELKSDPQATQTALQTLNDFFARALAVQQDPGLTTVADRMKALQATLEFQITDNTLRLAVTTPLGPMQRVQRGAARLVGRGETAYTIRAGTDDLESARREITKAAAELGFTPTYTAMAGDLAAYVLVPNLIADPAATAEERKRAAEAVKPIQQIIRTGDLIVGAGETVTQKHLDMLRALGLMDPVLQYSQALAVIALLSLLVFCLFFFTRRACLPAYRQFNRLVVIAALVAVVALVFRLGQASPYLEAYALTAVTAAAMLAALIACADVGLVVSALAALLFALIIPDANLKPVVAVFVCGGVAAYLVSLSSTRTGAFLLVAIGIAVFDASVLVVSTEAFAQQQVWQVVGATAAGGAVAALLAIGLMIALDRPLELLTDIRLAELASPHQPLLQRLLREAPGTYQSSVMVGSLAEQAAEAIGLNGTFVRTAALFHDIGKLKRPYFFVENQFGGENPHEKLSPYISALIISSHPRDGAEMAREAGLPPRIVAVIQQHQGTDLIRYFYEKAVEQAPEGTQVPEAGFRYPGPRPQTRETAVIMLADTVEAAVRTLDQPTPSAVERMVDRLVQSRIQGGQLDECPLTFAEVRTVRETLISSLNSTFHHRIKYPEQIPEEARLLAAKLPEDQRDGVMSIALEDAGDGPDERAG
ncbi:MAG TPA: HDIG domain-containing protein, partial [Armatimonadota bacterium]|nr:HDIG domain-containing protein [Armatimonadota bacterium]